MASMSPEEIFLLLRLIIPAKQLLEELINTIAKIQAGEKITEAEVDASLERAKAAVEQYKGRKLNNENTNMP